MKSCRVCLVDHTDEIHRTTVELHQWWRARIAKYLEVIPPPVPKTKKVLRPINAIGHFPLEEK